MNLPISCWAAEDRPSEKMVNLGLDALTNAELLSIIIGSGSSSMNAVDVSRQLLSQNENSLKKLNMATKAELAMIPGIGERKAAKIQAALELGCRMFNERKINAPELSTATRVYNYMVKHLYALETEEFWAIFCNQRYGLIKAERMFVGGITEVIVDVRLILKEALLNNTAILIVVHNHPSGNVAPSRVDDQLTCDIKKACELMKIHFSDHVIITDGSYYSYHENGKL